MVIQTKQGVDPAVLAHTQFGLANALWAAPPSQGRDRTRARTLAEQARDVWAERGAGWEQELAQVEAWLAEHRLP